MLIDDNPILVLPRLAAAIGLDEAIVVQQLHWWLKPSNKSGKTINGHKWIFNTYEQWQKDHFPWWSVIHIRRIFNFLEKLGVILSCQPEGGISRRKYYRLNQAVVIKMRNGDFPITPRTKRLANRIIENSSSAQLDHMDGSSGSLPSTETTFRENKQREYDIGKSDANNFQILALQRKLKELHLTKEEKLAKIPMPSTCPSADEFDDAVDEMDNGFHIFSSRPDLYTELRERKWHEWRERSKKWAPIRDWRKYVEALANKIADDMP